MSYFLGLTLLKLIWNVRICIPTFGVLGHALVRAVILVGHVEDLQLRPPANGVDLRVGDLVLAGLSARRDEGASETLPRQGHVRHAARLAHEARSLALVGRRLRGERNAHQLGLVCGREEGRLH